jgi:predicted amidohydrolase YtcJ
MRLRFALALACVLLVSVVTSGQRTFAPPDTIFINGKVITVDATFTIQQAFAVHADRFVAVATNQRIRALAGTSTRVVDLHGRTIIPGLGDNHNHLYESAKVLRGLSLEGVTSVSEALDRIQRRVASARQGETVFTTALRLPSSADTLTIRDLDQISATVPIVVIRSRLGGATFNTPALRLAGVTRETPSFAGVPLPIDATGTLTGQTPPFPETALQLTDSILPPMNDDEEETFLLKAMRQRNAVGLTSIRNLNLSPQAMRAYGRLRRSGALTLRVSMGLTVWDANKLDAALSAWGSGSGFGDEWLRVDSISEFPSPASPGMDRQRFTNVAVTANRYGWRLAPHLQGRDSVNLVLDAYEAADRVQPLRDKRWVLEHAPFATPTQMDRMARLGVVVSAQHFGYAEPVPSGGGSFPPPMRDSLDHHVVVSAGSDFQSITVTSDNPFIPIYFYVTRKTKGGEVIGPEQKISRTEALRVSTYNNAYTTLEETLKGSIEPGKLADFLILSDDVLTVPEDKILSIRPLATYVGGRQVYGETTDF